jgi:hypothetical protein
MEKPNGAAPYQQIPDMQEIVDTSISLTMPLHLRWQASYQLMACNGDGCTPSAEVAVIDSLAALTGAVGYFKAPNSGAGDGFGYSVALSARRQHPRRRAPNEDGSGKGVEPLDNNAAPNAGAVHVFVRVAENVWQKQAYLKATQSETFDQFGLSIALSADGNVLAVGAHLEDAQANTITNSGAVYMFVRSADVWKTSAYLKASNPGVGDAFGHNVALSADGNTLAVGAYFEDSSDIGIDGKKNDDAAPDSGAAYVFTWVNPSWVQQAYIKSSNSASLDRFGQPVALSADGNTLAVGAPFKDSEAGAAFVFVRDGDLWTEETQLKAKNAGAGDHFGLSASISADGDTLAIGANQEDSPGTGINDRDGDSMISENAGAAYVYERMNKEWTPTTYIKASNTGANDYFGLNLALSDDGSTLAITARDEDGGATGIGGGQSSNTHANAGAVFVFERALNTWAQRSYVKASNTGAGDRYGLGLALSGDGRLLVVGADLEDSNAKGINKDQANNGAVDAGAVYVY